MSTTGGDDGRVVPLAVWWRHTLLFAMPCSLWSLLHGAAPSAHGTIPLASVQL